MLLFSIVDGTDRELFKVFEQFRNSEDSFGLLSRLLCISEDKLQAFLEHSFSNSEIGALLKLRQQRDPSYVAAYL
jgi:hypothetical protein